MRVCLCCPPGEGDEVIGTSGEKCPLSSGGEALTASLPICCGPSELFLLTQQPPQLFQLQCLLFGCPPSDQPSQALTVRSYDFKVVLASLSRHTSLHSCPVGSSLTLLCRVYHEVITDCSVQLPVLHVPVLASTIYPGPPCTFEHDSLLDPLFLLL